MLTLEQIEHNKNTFIELIQSIQREGAEIEKLVTKLLNSDFFTAPASTKYHNNFAGGLCLHSLTVYRNLKSLVETRGDLHEECYDEDTLKIVALLHDISKMNYYEQYVKNTKVYCLPEETTTKCQDEIGYYRWVSNLEYKTRDHKFVYGSHEMASEYIARQFIPLTLSESVAILHHMGGQNWDSAKDNFGEVFTQYQLGLYLHLADMISTFVDEAK